MTMCDTSNYVAYSNFDKKGAFCYRKVKNLFKYFHTLALTEKHLRKTNTYQIGFNNFHFVLHYIYRFEPIFAEFSKDFEKKPC